MNARNDSKPEAERRWHIERGIPLVLVAALLGNAGVGIWFMAHLDSRVATVEAWTQANSSTPGKLSAVEAKIDVITELLFQRKAASR